MRNPTATFSRASSLFPSLSSFPLLLSRSSITLASLAPATGTRTSPSRIPGTSRSWYSSNSSSRHASPPIRWLTMAPSTFKLNTGQDIPAVGFGTWQAGPGEVAAAVTYALKVGYRLIDAAYCYGNEDEVGQGLKAAFDAGHARREDVFVITKLWNTYSSRAEVGLDKSLRALGLDYVDLFLVHWPVGMNPDGNDDRFPKLPDGSRDMLWDHDHVATWRRMEALVATGKARGVGVCNYSAPYLRRLLEHATVVPAVNQIENHPGLPQQDVVDLCREKGIHVIAYSPLGSSGGPLLQSEPVTKVAERKGVSPGTVLLSYHVARGSTVLAKSVTEARIKANLEIVDLDADDRKILDDYSAALARDGSVQRFVYPPFGVNFGFPDKNSGRSLPNGV
ncbi:Aldo/keto reductase [Durotheca rogersii]|uniref:Aldo/keto reductase n=1 Tax=Durotheca rogersii TaxID=419775 RepID=UPI00221EB3F2|nr:Aldo/keto reductase [Durotheca rogersii]KAI5860971.1 Aldo/keto reductase [Durotheca rogersii]